MQTWSVLKKMITALPTRSVKNHMRHKRKFGMFSSFKDSTWIKGITQSSNLCSNKIGHSRMSIYAKGVDTAFCTPYDSGPCSPMMLQF